MKIKAIGFDIGGTLVNYNKPLIGVHHTKVQ